MTDTHLHLEVDRKDFAATRLVQEPLAELSPGQVRLRIERFALTANNVTYAAVGDALGYWDFFPAEAGWGRVPAMGWGEIVASAHPDVAAGGRTFGWFPMSRYLDLAVSTTDAGLRDEGTHRSAHAPVYRGYTATDRDPLYEPGGDGEDRHALLRGLFLTAFLADDFLAEQAYFGASRVILLSASSKTAVGLAQCAAARKVGEVVGVTSARHTGFVSGLPWYDRVVPYDAIDALPVDADAICVDMAGNGDVLARVHARLGDRLRHSMAIGMSHHGAPGRPQGLVGPEPAFFFAPTQVGKRMQDWGPEEYAKRVREALSRFVDASRTWLTVTRSHGADAVAGIWRAALAGQVAPNVGHVVSMWDATR